jgi:hypothetical protein
MQKGTEKLNGNGFLLLLPSPDLLLTSSPLGVDRGGGEGGGGREVCVCGGALLVSHSQQLPPPGQVGFIHAQGGTKKCADANSEPCGRFIPGRAALVYRAALKNSAHTQHSDTVESKF